MSRPRDAMPDSLESSNETSEVDTYPDRAQSIALFAYTDGAQLFDEEPHVSPAEVADHSPPDTPPDARETSDHDGLTDEEARKFVEDTVKAFLTAGAELWAHLHGLGPVLKFGELVCKAAQWTQVVEGHREITVDVPIPLSGVLDLNLSAHLGADPVDGEPSMTAYCAPSQLAPVGVLAIGELAVGPGDTYDVAHEGSTPAVGEQPRAASEISDLQAREPSDLADEVTMVQRLAAKELVPQLRTQRRLRKGGVDLLVIYGSGMVIIMSVMLDKASQQASEVRIEPNKDGQSRICLRNFA